MGAGGGVEILARAPVEAVLGLHHIESRRRVSLTPCSGYRRPQSNSRDQPPQDHVPLRRAVEHLVLPGGTAFGRGRFGLSAGRLFSSVALPPIGLYIDRHRCICQGGLGGRGVKAFWPGESPIYGPRLAWCALVSAVLALFSLRRVASAGEKMAEPWAWGSLGRARAWLGGE